MTSIVCYGDSNTWGLRPGIGGRHDKNTRWTGLLQKLLGDEYEVSECGINSRTTSFDDPYRDYQNGRRGLGYSLLEHKPIDLLIISLGTNDLKFTNAAGSAKGLESLLKAAVNSAYFNNTNMSVFRGGQIRILVISPIPLGADLDEKFPNSPFVGKYSESLRFAELYKPVCDQFHAEFLDAAQYAAPSDADCLHMEPESHARLANAVYEKVLEIFK